MKFLRINRLGRDLPFSQPHESSPFGKFRHNSRMNHASVYIGNITHITMYTKVPCYKPKLVYAILVLYHEGSALLQSIF